MQGHQLFSIEHRGIKTGDKAGIIGIGGLGHMAVMIAKAPGAEVTAITTRQQKRQAWGRRSPYFV